MTLWKQHLHGPVVCHNFRRKIEIPSRLGEFKSIFQTYFNTKLTVLRLPGNWNLKILFGVLLSVERVFVFSICWLSGRYTSDTILQGKSGNVFLPLILRLTNRGYLFKLLQLNKVSFTRAAKRCHLRLTIIPCKHDNICLKMIRAVDWPL